MIVAPGVRIGAYEVIAPIGAGGIGEVYRARDSRLKRDVALKVVAERFALDANRLARFERGAHVLASVNHPNIATVYAIQDVDGVQALVMELVDGENVGGSTCRSRRESGQPCGARSSHDRPANCRSSRGRAPTASCSVIIAGRDPKVPPNVPKAAEGVTIAGFSMGKRELRTRRRATRSGDDPKPAEGGSAICR